MELSTYKNDELNGICRSWSPSGRLCQVEKYVDDMLDGLKICYYENGITSRRLSYKKGMKHGVHEYWEY
jgi:antitoxin component YwqK of YwqJK toxin-antitoxin module